MKCRTAPPPPPPPPPAFRIAGLNPPFWKILYPPLLVRSTYGDDKDAGTNHGCEVGPLRHTEVSHNMQYVLPLVFTKSFEETTNASVKLQLHLSVWSHGILFSKTGRKIHEVRLRKNSLAVMPFSHFALPITPDRESCYMYLT